MKEIFNSLLQKVPWLPTALSWTLAILLILVLLAVPAYFYFLPLFRKLRAETREWLDRLLVRHQSNRDDRQRRWVLAADAFRTDNLLKRIREGGRSIAAGVAARVKRQLRRLRRRLSDTLIEWKHLSTQSEKLSDSLRAFTFALGGPNNQLPDPPQMLQQKQGVGIAILQLVIGTPLLVGLIAMNTVMLSQILRDIGLIPPSYVVFGIPLVYFLALLLSGLEAGLGWAHSVAGAKHNAEEKRTVSFWPMLYLFLTLCLALFEAQNYYSMAPERTQRVTLPFTEYTIAKADAFFLLGFAIVWTLFALGAGWYRAGAVVVEGTTAGRLLRQLRKLRRKAIEYDAILRGTDDVLTQARQSLQQAASVAVDAPSLAELKTQLDRIDAASDQAHLVEQQDLTLTEVKHLSQKAGFWLVVGCVSIAIMTLTGLPTFAYLLHGLAPWLGWVLAIGHTIIFLGAGMLFSSGEVVAHGESGTVVEAPAWSRLSGIVLLALLLAFYLWVVFTSPFRLRIVWACDFVSGAFLFAVGSSLQPLMGVVTLFLKSIGYMLSTAMEFLARAFVWFLHKIALVLEYVSEVLAGPILFFKRPSGGNKAESRMGTAA